MFYFLALIHETKSIFERFSGCKGKFPIQRNYSPTTLPIIFHHNSPSGGDYSAFTQLHLSKVPPITQSSNPLLCMRMHASFRQLRDPMCNNSLKVNLTTILFTNSDQHFGSENKIQPFIRSRMNRCLLSMYFLVKAREDCLRLFVLTAPQMTYLKMFVDYLLLCSYQTTTFMYC